MAEQVVVRLFPTKGQLTIRQAGLTWPQILVENTAMIARAQDFSPLFKEFHPKWQAYLANEVFDAQGPGWPALSPAYAARKTGPGMMRETDRLYNSLVSDGGDSVVEYTNQSLKKGSNVPYFGYHQTGTRRMPARPTLVLRQEWAEELAGGMAQFVATGRVRF